MSLATFVDDLVKEIKMSHYKKIKKSQLVGLRYTGMVVQEYWECRWQKLDAENDDAIDGIILYERKSKVTDAIYVQVKAGRSYRVKSEKKYPDQICLGLGEEYINSHRPRWCSYPGPVILVYMEPAESPKKQELAWWVDLKDPSSYTDKAKSYILVPKDQIFDITAKKRIYALTAHRHDENSLVNIDTSNEILNHLSLSNDTIKDSAHKYYLNLSRIKITPACVEFKYIIFTRVGWKHITRKTRSLQRILQSLILLPVIKEIIEKIKRYEIVDHKFEEDELGGGTIFQTLLLRARVSFPFRYPAVINVILRRKISVSLSGEHVESKTWFYSIYESRRKRELIR
jgi:hypothetical protein